MDTFYMNVNGDHSHNHCKICKNHQFGHLKFVLYSLQAAEEVLSLAEDGEEPRGISINHYAEDKLLSLSTDPFELVWD